MCWFEFQGLPLLIVNLVLKTLQDIMYIIAYQNIIIKGLDSSTFYHLMTHDTASLE